MSCKPVNDDENSSTNDDGVRLTTTIDYVGHRAAIIGATAQEDLKDVGFILTDSSTDLVHNASLKTDKAYYTRDISANKKTSVYLSVLKGFALTSYNPNPTTYNNSVDPATIKVLQPGTKYFVHIFYTEDGIEKVSKVEVTTISHLNGVDTPASKITVSSIEQHVQDFTIRAKVGEVVAFPSISHMNNVSVLQVFLMQLAQTSVLVENFGGGVAASPDNSGVSIYRLTNTTYRDLIVFRQIQTNDQYIKFSYLNDSGNLLEIQYNIQPF